MVERSRIREKCLLASLRLSVRFSACVVSAVTERIFVRFDIGGMYDNLVRKSKFG
jgi:hypothetical protein